MRMTEIRASRLPIHCPHAVPLGRMQPSSRAWASSTGLASVPDAGFCSLLLSRNLAEATRLTAYLLRQA